MKPTENQIQSALKTLENAGFFALSYHSVNEIYETYESQFEEGIQDGDFCQMTDQDAETIKAEIVRRWDKGWDISFDEIVDIISEHANKSMKTGTFDNSLS